MPKKASAKQKNKDVANKNPRQGLFATEIYCKCALLTAPCPALSVRPEDSKDEPLSVLGALISEPYGALEFDSYPDSSALNALRDSVVSLGVPGEGSISRMICKEGSKARFRLARNLNRFLNFIELTECTLIVAEVTWPIKKRYPQTRTERGPSSVSASNIECINE